MGHLGKGYGSEHHFLAYYRERRAVLDRAILTALGRPHASIEWIYPTPAPNRKEPEGLSFLADRPDVRATWGDFWPTRAVIRRGTASRA